ncbi:MAG TPA: cytochrome c biogenesis heme-transporting ATPase CcmA [Gammaproteobacteria bacterium]|jgi:heme exporter protein A|nr:cytochrome c biogenesis heme-transporting ATPase CcmA [Gammaproteobacteria bacterium]
MNQELAAQDLGLWRGERCLCRGISFSLANGSLLQFAGPNGSGKTSLMRAVAGVGRLDEGAVTWNGTPIRRSEEYRGSLAYLGHHNGLKSQLSAIENYVFYQSITVTSSGIRAQEALRRLGLPEEAQQRPVVQLSMGQRRRAALARLLAARTRLWILDEPLTGLDVDGAALVTGLLAGHARQGGMAIIATHQPLAPEGVPLQRLELGAAA